MAVVNCAFIANITVKQGSNPYFHTHQCTELIYFLSGTGEMLTARKNYCYREGMFGIYQPGERHADLPHSDGLQLCIGVSGCGAQKLPVGVWKPTSQIETLFQQLNEEKNASDSSMKELRMDIYAGLLVLEIAAMLNLEQYELKPTITKEKYPQLAMQEIEAHLTGQFNLDLLAERLFISKSYMRQLFKERYGESPLAYLLRRKIELSCELLNMTDLPIKEIAHRIGIDNVYYFSTLFARKMNMSPTTYRIQMRK